MKYAILTNPLHGKVYFDAAAQIALMEFLALADKAESNLYDIKYEMICGINYITFESERQLTEENIGIISRLSAFYALFEKMESKQLSPIAAAQYKKFPDSMSSMLKYSGKTNEVFTRMLVNLAYAACDFPADKKLALFDPLCGKGTTLYEGLIGGFCVTGMELNGIYGTEIENYIIKYLENGKYKHKAFHNKVNHPGGRKLANVFSVKLSADKEEYARDITQSLTVATGDSCDAQAVFGKNKFDIIVTDLPYGVQHGSKATGQQSVALSRSPLKLLDKSLPGWFETLHRGGAMVLAFNEFTAKHGEIIKLLEQYGGSVLGDTPYHGYLHRVDQAINRNVVVAVKKG